MSGFSAALLGLGIQLALVAVPAGEAGPAVSLDYTLAGPPAMDLSFDTMGVDLRSETTRLSIYTKPGEGVFRVSRSPLPAQPAILGSAAVTATEFGLDEGGITVDVGADKKIELRIEVPRRRIE